MTSFVLETDVGTAETKWDLCFICQKVLPKSSQIVNPSKKRGFDPNKPETYGSYTTVANNLCEWIKESELPAGLSQRILKLHDANDQSEIKDSLQNLFVEHSSIFHKNCTTKYDQTKLKRKIDDNEKNETKIIPTPSPKKRGDQQFHKDLLFCASRKSYYL